MIAQRAALLNPGYPGAGYPPGGLPGAGFPGAGFPPGLGFDPYGGMGMGMNPYGGMGVDPFAAYGGAGFDPFAAYGLDAGAYEDPIVSNTKQYYDPATESFYSNEVRQEYDPSTDTFSPVANTNPYNPYNPFNVAGDGDD